MVHKYTLFVFTEYLLNTYLTTCQDNIQRSNYKEAEQRKAYV